MHLGFDIGSTQPKQFGSKKIKKITIFSKENHVKWSLSFIFISIFTNNSYI